MSDSPSTSDASFWRLVAFFLLFALIGVYLLYEWYDDRLKAQLATKDGQVEEAQRYAEVLDARCSEAESKRDALHAALAEQGERHARELTLCEGRISELGQSCEQLEQDHVALQREHAAALADADDCRARCQAERMALQEQHGAIEAELQARCDESRQTMAEMEADLAAVRETIVQSGAEHRAYVETLERHLNERVRLSSLTPVDGELLRLAREIGMLPEETAPDEQASEDAAPADTADRALAEAQEELNRLREEHTAEREAREQVVTELNTRLESAEQALAEAREAHARELDAVRARLLKQQDCDQQEVCADQAELLQVREQLRERESRLADLEASAEEDRAALAALERELADTRQRLDAAHQEAAEALAALQEQLAAEQRRVAELQAELEGAQGQASAPPDADSSAQLSAAQARILELEQRMGEVRALYQRFAELGAIRTDSGMLLRLANSELRFPPGGATLPDAELPSLDRIATLLADYPALSLRIEGHSDSSGRADINQRLSAERAGAVREALIERGIGGERMRAEGLGSARPIADNATADGRARNRRVEVYVIEQ